MKKRILVAPLNWGLGHASRCIPIINALLKGEFTPVIASDGAALELLKKEFPDVECFPLPPYNITYPKKGQFLKYKLFLKTPQILNAIRGEHQILKSYLKNKAIDGIISDNRYGIYNPNIPSVLITHQLRVLSGSTTWLSTKIQQNLLGRFNECWVPDVKNEPNLSGAMGHEDFKKINIKHIGLLSRFQKNAVPNQYDILILLSGPEPQRTLLEHQLMATFQNSQQTVLMVRGVMAKKQQTTHYHHLKSINFMTSDQLEQTLNESDIVIARSGYSTVMDLAKLGKKAFFIPTPGQFEQLYLAQKMENEHIAPYCSQNKFSLEKLSEITGYTGFNNFGQTTNFDRLFDLF